jgi:hypothetical protein
MKTVFNNQELCHVWASQSQKEGRGSHMFFEGPSIFSYGHHFEIARIVKPGTVLFTDRGCSVTTSKHKRYARNAVSHMAVYTVPYFDDHNGNVDSYANRIATQVEEDIRANEYEFTEDGKRIYP